MLNVLFFIYLHIIIIIIIVVFGIIIIVIIVIIIIERTEFFSHNCISISSIIVVEKNLC